ncbi:DUF3592 domain-containing protein [Paraburkholderia sp. HD33-4]|uniref:DUF3592 domain-containing protein n=1 Tax=Paraburkholderia sp. HD33-4 TaxID=2883242 RepID=UPI001F1B5EAE|nr:DUF3592 domain-containing protein [Paraburkholderia sp. HD33-4]
MNALPPSERRVTARPALKRAVLQSLFLAAGGVWLAYGVFDGWHWQNVEKNWASTDGIIETAYVRRAMSRHVNWETGWTYSYSVDGRKYEAESTALSNAYFVHMFGSETQAEGDEYTRPVRSAVTVYYDPVEPQRSVLDLATDSSLEWLTLSLAAMCMAPAIYGAFALHKALRNRPSGN